MTLEDLVNIFDDTHLAVHSRRAGIRAVVEALRETFGLAYSEGRMSMVRGGNENHQRQWVDALINEILASDGEVKAAGASTRKDEVGARTPPASPAAAPDVCEWTFLEVVEGVDSYHTNHGQTSRFKSLYGNCIDCGKPISFKSEAAR
jgi:hypothetical protein